MKHDISELKKLAVAGGALVKVAKVVIPAGLELAKAVSFMTLISFARVVYPIVSAELPKVLIVQSIAWPEVAGEAIDIDAVEAVELVQSFFGLAVVGPKKG